MAEAPLYIGLDLSTQQLKGIVVSSDLKLLHEAKVDFDADLAHYGIHKGVLQNNDEGEIFAPVGMWLEALDLVMARLVEQGCAFKDVRGISGAGMQHGVVFWSGAAAEVMSRVGRLVDLVEEGAFAHNYSPNWQDASTQRECEMFDKELGGEEELARVTGSKAHHRFSGPQIMRYRTKYPEAYESTKRISLVSSFLSSVLLGKIAPMDIGDVCGANLWDINRGAWDEQLLALAAGGTDGVAELKNKLGTVDEDGGICFGHISNYLVNKYKFSTDCQVIAATGDNPATILSLPLRASDAMVSLGTSTTFLMSTPRYVPDSSYHFMNHPTTAGLYMFMLCYKNGGLAREKIRDAINSNDSKVWDKFNDIALKSNPLGQQNATDPWKLGLYFPLPEIVPNVPAGTWRYLYTPSSNSLSPTQEWSDPQTNARAILESQFLSLRYRSQNLVSSQTSSSGAALPPQPRRIYLVGGGSQNRAIAELCADVLGSAEGVYKLDIGGNACALGAAYKAVWGCERRSGETFEALIGGRWDESGFVKKICEGYREGVWERYGQALRGFQEMERRVLRECGGREGDEGADSRPEGDGR